MIRPSHALPQRSASEVFTDREDARERFSRALDEPQSPQDYRVLVWYGVGGQGKTALQAEFGRMIDRARGNWVNVRNRRLASSLVDLENPANRNPAQALLSLRLQLAEHGHMRFPAFDLAFARYFTLDQPGKDIRAVHPELFKRGSEVLADVLSLADDAASLIPGYGLLTKYGSKLAARGAEALQTWWDRRGRTLLVGLDEMSIDQLAGALPKYLGYDLCEAMAATDGPRVIIRLDTHEALWRDRGLRDGPGALLVDDWLRRLVQDTPGALVIITGRDRLRWGEIDADWDQIVEQHLLGGLSDEDAATFLGKVGVTDPEIRARMIAAARGEEGEGCLPYYLDLERETHDALVAGGQTPTAQQFGGGRAEILARFLAHLDPETEKRLRLASYPETLDPASLAILSNQFLKEPDTEGWKRLLSRAFVEHPLNGPPTLHALTRATLQASERQDHWDRFRDVHQWFWWGAEEAMSPAGQPVTADDERRFLTAIHHMVALGSARSLEWSMQRLQRFRDAARSRTVEAATSRLMPLVREQFGPASVAALLAWQAVAAGDLGRPGQAEALLRQALDIYATLEEPDGENTVNCQGNLAGALSDQGRDDEAEALYVRVLDHQRATFGPDHPITAVTLNNLALVYQKQGCLREAAELMTQAIDISMVHAGPTHPSTAIGQSNLAGVLNDLGDYDRADVLVSRAKATLFEQVGPHHPYVWLARGVAAGTAMGRRDYAASKALFLEVRDGLEGIFGPAHLHVTTVRGRVARCDFWLGDLAGARAGYCEALDQFEAGGHADMPIKAFLLAGLAAVDTVNGRLDVAGDGLALARAILEPTTPPAHPLWSSLDLIQARLERARGNTDAARRRLLTARQRLIDADTLPGEEARLHIDEALAGLGG